MFDLRKLEAFCKVYELRSFSRAGDALFLSQPTVSAHVQSLERDAGVKLLDRMGRTVLPTPAGAVLYKHAVKAFAELDTAKSEIGRLMGYIAGELRLGASTIPAAYLLPQIVTDFVERYPAVALKLQVGDSSEMIRALLEGGVMLAVVGAMEKHSDLEFIPIVDDDLVLVAAGSLKELCGGKSEYSFAEAAAWPWIMREEGSGTRRTLEDGLAAAGHRLRDLRIVLDVSSTQTALQYSLAGLGVSISSRIVAQKHLEQGELVELKVKGLSFQRRFYVAHNLRRELFPAAMEFASFVHKACAGLRKAEA